MTDWRDSVLAFSAHPEVGTLLLGKNPAWVWSREGRLLWANPAGGVRLRLPRLAAAAGRDCPVGHQFRRELDSLMRSIPDKGTLARLRPVDDLHALPVACRCRRVRVGEERGLLAVALETADMEPSLADLAVFFSSDEVSATIFDAAGKVLAQGGPESAGRDSGEAYAEFAQDGQSRRFYLSRPQVNEAVPVPARETSAEDARVQPEELEISPAEQGSKPAASIALQGSVKPPDNAKPAEPPWDGPVDAARVARMVVVASKTALTTPGFARPAASSVGGLGQGIQNSAALPKPPPPEATDPVEPPPSRSITAGRVARELSRKPVRFLWQTDGSDRFLFVSPGLAQVVGRNAEIVGERWQDAAARLRLDPTLRIARAVAQRDTWSGQTAWWPVEGSNVRVPAELTALPIFGPDHSFQGYRGFGVLRPAEALMPAAFEGRFGAVDQAAASLVEQLPPYEEAVATSPAVAPAANVVPIRADLERSADQARLTAQERSAFEEIAAALRDRVSPASASLGQNERAPEPPPPLGTPAVQPQGEQGASHAQGKPEPDALEVGSQTEVLVDTESAALAPVELESDARPSTEKEVLSEQQAVSPAEIGEPEAPHPEPARGEVQEASAAEDTAAKPKPTSAPDSVPNPAPTPARSGSIWSPQTLEGASQRRVRELTAILDTATDGVLILDAEGTIESVNAGAEALFGLEAHELQGTDFGELLTPESRQSALDYLSGLIDNGVASLLNEGREIEAQAGPGSIPLFMTMGRISGDDGGRFCAVLRDITHWKRTEAELVAARRAAEEASAQKSDFIARVSHEIRTPLNAIIGFAEVMIEERFGSLENERYREYIRDIRVSGEHVVSLINDLLDISKIEAGKLDLDFGAVPLNDLVRECIGLMQPQANRARVVLRSSLSRDVPAIVADARTLRQIVLNLLSNSVKFTGPGGQVIASTSLLDSGEALLRVRDTGEGMSEEELARALEPFRQIATATLSDRTGTGLGLPLTKALVEANRAGLAIRSARGEGTVVTVTFPPTRVLSE